jgi:hypothetical protein
VGDVERAEPLAAELDAVTVKVAETVTRWIPKPSARA